MNDKKLSTTSTSKKGLVLSWVSSWLLSIIVVVGVFCTDKDMSLIVTICGFSWAETGIYDAFYNWKSKCENKSKYAQSWVEKLADKYGIENITPIIQSIIQD